MEGVTRGRVTDYREGTPKWLAAKLEVSDRMVRAALRKLYPRVDSGRTPWGILTEEQQQEVEKVVTDYKNAPSPKAKILYPGLR